MTNNENRVSKDSEVEVKEKENDAVVLNSDLDNDQLKNDNEEATVDFDENEPSALSESNEERSKDSEDEFSNSYSETKERMSRTEKVVLSIIALVLLLLLILFGIRALNKLQRGADDAHDSIDTQITSSQDGDLGDSESRDDSSISSKSKDVSESDFQKNEKSAVRYPGYPSRTNSNNENDGMDINDYPATVIMKDNNNDTVDNNLGIDANNSIGSSTNSGKIDNSVPEYAGEMKISITKVTDETGIITVNVDDQKIVIPVQTTVFNGRVTKSGVAQGKLYGYNCGATLMLYYPQSTGMGDTQFYGYMNRTTDSLTILVDINGEESKLLIKINGLKTLY